MIAASRTRIAEDCRGRDPLRLLVMGGLAIYLLPALLVVMLVGGLGVVCCTMQQLVRSGLKAAQAAAHHDRPTTVFGGHHLHAMTQRRLPR